MKSKVLEISKIESNPWHFRIFSKMDHELLVNQIKDNGISSIPPPIIASIDDHFYIIDGHSRVQAAKKIGLQDIPCLIESRVKNYRELRISSFKLNRHGYSNPLPLSDMFNEDIKLCRNLEEVSDLYGVSKNYVETLVSISNLHDDTKAIMQKIFIVTSKKYQFILEQITPAHVSSLSKLLPKKQIELINWIFHDVMYGPPTESHISIPSILEITHEIEKINNTHEHKNYKKNKSIISKKQMPLTCRCGLKYDINFKTNKIYEYHNLENITLKKELIQPIQNVKSFRQKIIM